MQVLPGCRAILGSTRSSSAPIVRRVKPTWESTHAVAEAPVTQPKRSIPSLDGWRAVSILLVLALHALQGIHFRATSHIVDLLVYTLANGAMGVRIFFVISGYLITRLLLQEHERTGSISLGSFYLRRVFRILPPLYVYLGVLVALILAGRLLLAPRYPALAAVFLTIYVQATDKDFWALEHTWSLCVEEQFYVLWPFVLVWAFRQSDLLRARARATRVAIIGILIIALVRIPWSAPPFTKFHSLGNAALQLDGILFGALAAVAEGQPTFERWYGRATRSPWLIGVALFAFSSGLEIAVPGKYIKSVGAPLDGLLIMWLLLWTVRQPATRAGRFLNWRPLTWIGVLSYSLYLWQTLLLHSGNEQVLGFARHLPVAVGILLVFAAGAASFYLVERPMLALRSRVTR